MFLPRAYVPLMATMTLDLLMCTDSQHVLDNRKADTVLIFKTKGVKASELVLHG
jgi:hypothetical protein